MIHHGQFATKADLYRQDYDLDNECINHTLLVRQTSRQFIGWPYGQCSTYSLPSVHTFNATSHNQCYRQCIQYQYKCQLNCSPIFIDNFIIESDNSFSNSSDDHICDQRPDFWSYRKEFEPKFRDKCLRMCPKDCLSIDYSYIVKKDVLPRDVSEEWGKEFGHHYYYTIEWDASEPMTAYIDEPVITFTEYLVYCGGLMGLWFGTSANDLVRIVVDREVWISLLLLMKQYLVFNQIYNQ